MIADRTACSILTLFIVSTTCRPLNKKSVCCQTVIITANSQSAHLSARTLQSAVSTKDPVSRRRRLTLSLVSAHAWEARSPRSHRTALCRLAAVERNAITVYRCWDLGLRFVFLCCILWLNDTSYSKSVKRDK